MTFEQTMYAHYWELYQAFRFTDKSAMIQLRALNHYGHKLIEQGELTLDEHKINKLPYVNIEELFNHYEE